MPQFLYTKDDTTMGGLVILSLNITCLQTPIDFVYDQVAIGDTHIILKAFRIISGQVVDKPSWN